MADDAGFGEANKVSTVEVLKEVGFAEDPSDQQRGFSFTIGRFKLWALPCLVIGSRGYKGVQPALGNAAHRPV